MNTSILNGIVTLFIFQFLGECLSIYFGLILPGAIVGMVLLLMFLFFKKSSFASLDTSVIWILRYLPLLLIPAAAGIITQIDTISQEFWAIVISLGVGTFVALAFSMKLMDFLISKKEERCYES